MKRAVWLALTFVGIAIAAQASASVLPPATGEGAQTSAELSRAARDEARRIRLEVFATDEAEPIDDATAGDPDAIGTPGELTRGLALYRAAETPAAYAQAAELFSRIADTDAGRVAYAYMLGIGLGVEHDERRAHELLSLVRGAYQGRAWYVRALLDERSPRPESKERARVLLSCAARAGDGLALNHLGVQLERERRPGEAKRMYAAAARQGVPEAASNRERLQQAQDERVSRTDFAELRARARAGDRDAMFALGRAFHRGQDVAVDYTEALHWYRLAAARGHPEAQHMLTLIVANPSTSENIDPPWMRHLATHRTGAKGEWTLTPDQRLPLGERDPLHSLETLQRQPFRSTTCEVSS